MRNKIKFFILLSCLLLSCFLMSGCVSEGAKEYNKNANLIQINNELYYYAPTGIIYIVFNKCSRYQGYGYMSPYYSTNGNLCKYNATTNSIVEIEN